MKILKEIMLFMITVGSVLGCIKSYHIWEEQKHILDEMRYMVMDYTAMDQAQKSNFVWRDSDPYMLDWILEERNEELESLEQEIKSIQMKYDLQKLIEGKANTQEPDYRIYQKYFRIKQGELARIEDLDDLSDCETFGYLNNPFSGVTFDIYDGISLQYANGKTSQIWEYSPPRAVIITGTALNLGFMDARAGMNFEQIMQNAYEEEIKQGFMYFDNDTVYYIQYADDFFLYSFISDYEDGRGSKLIVTQLAEEIPQMGESWEEKGSTVWLHWMPANKFEEIEKKHEILAYDISSSPRYDYENTLLREYIDELKKEDEKFIKNDPLYEMRVDYHLFDFNDDGIEDYLLCIDGSGYTGTAGHWVEIFVGREDGTVEEVLHIHLRFHNGNMPSGHERFTVLNEKSGGYYAIVLPGSNRILRYDREEGRYEFQEIE